MRSTLPPYLVTRRRQSQARKPGNAEFVICNQSIDFAYVWTWHGFVYVAFVIDMFALRIVDWRVSNWMRTGFVLDALEQALHFRRPEGSDGLCPP
jgi:transposase InsO family protein